MPPKADYDTIVRALRDWSGMSPELVYEIRSLTIYRGRTNFGYFNDPELAANLIVNSDNEDIKAWYVTLNPVMPDLMARCSNRMQPAKTGGSTTKDQILYRRELLLDFDPERHTETSSTDELHDLALSHAKHVTGLLSFDHNFPAPALVDSGNGAHARYWFAEGVPNTPEVTALIKTVQNIINDNFSTIKIKLDTKVYDAPRVVRIPGTVARKGENLPSNPHRTSRILRSFDPSDRLTVETLEKFVKSFPDQTKPLIAQAHRHLIEYPKDEQLYRNLNKIARERIHDWVPDLFAGIVRTHGEGYRIASDDVGRDLQEDICILPNGAIKDFGVHDLGDETEGRRTPVSLVAEFLTNGNKRLAAEKLSLVLNVEMDPFTGNPLIPPPLPVGDVPAVMPAILLGGNQCDLAHPTLLSKLLSETVIPVTYTVDGLLAENTHTVLSGPAKSGKSTLVYRLVVHARMGLPFLGRATKQCNVLWLALEERDYRFHRKIRKEIDDLLETEWAGLVTREEVLEELGKVRFYTIDNTKND
jgi:hypothetical protein